MNGCSSTVDSGSEQMYVLLTFQSSEDHRLFLDYRFSIFFLLLREDETIFPEKRGTFTYTERSNHAVSGRKRDGDVHRKCGVVSMFGAEF